MKKTWGDRVRNLSSMQKCLLTGLVFLAIYAIIGFIALPATIRYIAADQISKALGRQASIETVRLNPFTLTVSVKNFGVKQKESANDMVSFQSLFLNLEWISLFRLAPVVSQVRLDAPTIHLYRDEQGVFNFSDLLLPRSETPAPDPEPVKPEEESAPFRFSVANIEIVRGKIVFQDSAKDTTHRVENLNLGVPFVSTIGQAAQVFVMPNFSADINGKPFSLDGRTKPFHETLETTLRLELKELDLPYYMEYVPAALPVSVTSGALTIGLTVSFMNADGKSPDLELTGDLDLRDLAVADSHRQPLFSLKRLNIALEPSRVLDGDIHLSAISLNEPAVHILRDAEGNLNIYGLQSEADVEAPAAAQPTEGDSENESPFRVRLDAFRLADAAVLLKDNPKPGGQTKAELAAEKIISLPLLEIDAVTMDTETRQIGLNEIRSSGGVLLIDRLKDGTLNLQALAGPGPEPEPAPTAASPPTTAEPTPSWTVYLKTVGLDNYQVLAANLQSPGSGAAMVALASLALNGITVESSPAAVTIEDIHCTGLDVALRIEDDNGPAPEQAAESEGKTDADAAGQSAAKPAVIDIGRIALEDSRFRFSDRSPQMPFRTELADINLKITGLSSRPDQMASILFSALLDKQASLNLSGDINPLAENIYADIALTFENMELSSLSPYSGKYIGRNIGKGKLFTDFGYTVKEQVLAGKNHIFIDQLELGEKVDSPDAIKLPVQLAISLLQDREGKIVLDVPVSGNLDDPKFSLVRTILQVFSNLVTKAATSPFSLVSGLLGGVDPSHLVFAPGSAEIGESLGPVIDSLAELLYNRPALAVELAGFVDREQDGRVLSERLFMRKLKAVKHAQLPPEAAQSTPVNSIIIAPEEYEAYLWQAYKREDFPKEKSALGLDKRLSVEEMEALMRQHIQSDEKSLKMLADRRARQVRDYLLATGKVEPDRVFVVEAPYLKPEPVDGVGNNRVDVKLK